MELDRRLEASRRIARPSMRQIAEQLIVNSPFGNPDSVLPNPGCPDYSSGKANAVSVVPEGIITICRPSSMKVMGAAPQMREPVW